jgi:uncharacterized protein (TIGR02679 family)
MVHDEARLRELLGGADARWLRERLRSGYERAGRFPARVTLRRPTDAQRELVDRLFGRVSPGAGGALGVAVDRLERTLREAAICDDLAEALVCLDGPLRDRRAEADAVERAWDSAHREMAARVGARPWLGAWLEELRASGLLKRMSEGDPVRARELVERALEVVDRFPFAGQSLPELAARAYGDAHALDKHRELGQLAIRAAARHAALDDWQSADGRRECWAAVGVLCDELSAPVLTLNLGASGQGDSGEALTDRVLALHRDVGEACSISLRELVRHPPRLAHLAGRDVYVCENPTVVAVATERLGRRSAPLVCTSGHLRAAARVLLRWLAAAGARLRVQADMDIDGLHIAGRTLELPGARPWRMSADAYRAAPAGPTLRRDDVPPTPWDPELSRAMSARGVAVHEETILELLLGDLASRA